MMRKSGFHTQKTSPQLREAIDLIRPSVIVSLAHDGPFWTDVKRAHPKMLLIGRRWEEEQDWRNVDPRTWAEKCASLGMPYDAFITRNEPEDIHNWITMDLAARHDDWCCQFRRRIVELGYEAVALNVPTGHFHRNAVVNLFPNICQTYRFIGLHEYSARVMWDQDPKKQRHPNQVPKNEGNLIGRWYCQRYRDWHDGIIARWPERAGKFEMIITECGITYGVMETPRFGDVGWQTDLGIPEYMASLIWYFTEMNLDTYCRGGAIFMVGVDDWKRWNTFETLHVANRLLEVPETHITPIPDNGGNGEEHPMDIRIYDFDTSPAPNAPTRDWAWLRSVFGDIQVHPIEKKAGLELKEGDIIYKLVYLDAVRGATSVITNVRDQAGKPIQNETAIFGWSQAPKLEIPSKPWFWTTIGVPGPTNVNGDCGPSMGKGAYYSPADGQRGPHWVWIAGKPADYVDGLGMISGTFHDHVNLGYMAMPYKPDDNGNGENGQQLKELIVTLRSFADHQRGAWQDLYEALES